MQPLDLQVIRQARAWIAQGRPVWLCTVLATYGSAPRGPGAMLVCLPTGEYRGSLSGGCVEDDFLQRVSQGFFSPLSQVVRYGEGGLAPTRALPCGGVLDVLVECLMPNDHAAQHLQAIESALAGSALITRHVLLGTERRRVGIGRMDTPRVAIVSSRSPFAWAPCNACSWQGCRRSLNFARALRWRWVMR